RLARYGVPLAQTAPAGLTAAGIAPPVLMPAGAGHSAPPDVEEVGRAPGDVLQEQRSLTATDTSVAEEATVQPGKAEEEAAALAVAGTADATAAEETTPAVRHGGAPGGGGVMPPYTAEDRVAAFLRNVIQPGQLPAQPDAVTLLPTAGTVSEAAALDASQQPAHEASQFPVAGTSAGTVLDSAGDGPAHPQTVGNAGAGVAGESDSRDLTTVDRYFLAWWEYQRQHNEQPTGGQLSKFLAGKGIVSKTGSAVSPSTLRRYFLEFRAYAVWAAYADDAGREPTAEELAQQLAKRNITGQYGAVIAPESLDEELFENFRRRHEALGFAHSVPAPL
ncbi:hypothetical protein ACIRUK_41945, partial [Streptomyces sp. NPDC101150]